MSVTPTERNPETRHGRTAICDKCGKPRNNCLWIRREDSQRSYVLCSRCRDLWKVYGVAMTNVDENFGEVAL